MFKILQKQGMEFHLDTKVTGAKVKGDTVTVNYCGVGLGGQTVFDSSWTRGTPANAAAWAKWAAERGFVGVAPDYRVKERFGTSPLESVADGRAALRWVQEHAAELGIDPQSDNYAPQPAVVPAGAGSPLAGTTWVITGTLSQPRETFADRIRAAGGKVSGSVSAKTSWLLAGTEAGSKLEKARQLKVKVLDEAGFEALLAGQGQGGGGAADPAGEDDVRTGSGVQPELFG